MLNYKESAVLISCGEPARKCQLTTQAVFSRMSSHVVFNDTQSNMHMLPSTIESLNSVEQPIICVFAGLEDEYRDLASLMLHLLFQTKQVYEARRVLKMTTALMRACEHSKVEAELRVQSLLGWQDEGVLVNRPACRACSRPSCYR